MDITVINVGNIPKIVKGRRGVQPGIYHDDKLLPLDDELEELWEMVGKTHLITERSYTTEEISVLRQRYKAEVKRLHSEPSLLRGGGSKKKSRVMPRQSSAYWIDLKLYGGKNKKKDVDTIYTEYMSKYRSNLKIPVSTEWHEVKFTSAEFMQYLVKGTSGGITIEANKV